METNEQERYFWEPEEALRAMKDAGWAIRGIVGDIGVESREGDKQVILLSLDLLCDPEGAVCCLQGLDAHKDVYADPSSGIPTPHEAVHVLKGLPRPSR